MVRFVVRAGERDPYASPAPGRIHVGLRLEWLAPPTMPGRRIVGRLSVSNTGGPEPFERLAVGVIGERLIAEAHHDNAFRSDSNLKLVVVDLAEHSVVPMGDPAFSVDFALDLPWETQATRLGGRQVGTTPARFQAALYFEKGCSNALNAPLDLEPVPAVAAVVGAIDAHGPYRFREAEARNERHDRSTIPLVQVWYFNDADGYVRLRLRAWPRPERTTFELTLVRDRRRDPVATFDVPTEQPGDVAPLMRQVLADLHSA